MNNNFTYAEPFEYDLDDEDVFSEALPDDYCFTLYSEGGNSIKHLLISEAIINGLKAGGMSKEDAIFLLKSYDECL